MNRRGFLRAAFALSASTAVPTWADIGSPIALGAAKNSTGEYVVAGIGAKGDVVFQTPIPLRGHGFAAHPTKAIAVAFARRPGNLAFVFNLASGTLIGKMDLGDQGHFYGHGVFTRDGKYLLTTQNNLATSQGQIGVWDIENNYAYVDEKPTQGIGPHEMIHLPNGDYAVANGGILTDPAFERKKLNLTTMDPSLVIFDTNLNVKGRYRLPKDLHQLSIRHLAAYQDQIGLALQWEGDPREAQPVIAWFDGENIQLAEESRTGARNYIGSAAANQNGVFAFSAPKAGKLFIGEKGGLKPMEMSDIYGLAKRGDQFTGTAKGRILSISGTGAYAHQESGLDWDNHLLSIGS